MPAAAEWVRSQGSKFAAAKILFVGNYDYDRRDLVFALSSDGDLWPRNGGHVNLGDEYRESRRRLLHMVLTTAEEELP